MSKASKEKAQRKKPSPYTYYNEKMKWDGFLKLIKPYRHIRVGVEGGEEPFSKIFFRVVKREVIDTVRMNQMEVTFTVMVNPTMANDIGVMYISKMRMTLLDENDGCEKNNAQARKKNVKK